MKKPEVWSILFFLVVAYLEGALAARTFGLDIALWIIITASISTWVILKLKKEVNEE